MIDVNADVSRRRRRAAVTPVSGQLLTDLSGQPVWEHRSGLAGPVAQLLAAAIRGGPGPWRVQLRHPQLGPVAFEVRGDGSVAGFGSQGPVPVLPARSVPTPQLPVLGAHAGAGATAWAQLLHGVEIDPAVPFGSRPLVVVRSTLAGVESAKTFAAHGGAVLVVADAPGRVSRDVRRGIRVLSGAVPVVGVPWVPALRGVAVVPESPAVKKAAATVAAAVRKQWRNTGE